LAGLSRVIGAGTNGGAVSSAMIGSPTGALVTSAGGGAGGGGAAEPAAAFPPAPPLQAARLRC
jgi:hypothetical protein